MHRKHTVAVVVIGTFLALVTTLLFRTIFGTPKYLEPAEIDALHKKAIRALDVADVRYELLPDWRSAQLKGFRQKILSGIWDIKTETEVPDLQENIIDWVRFSTLSTHARMGIEGESRQYPMIDWFESNGFGAQDSSWTSRYPKAATTAFDKAHLAHKILLGLH